MEKKAGVKDSVAPKDPTIHQKRQEEARGVIDRMSKKALKKFLQESGRFLQVCVHNMLIHTSFIIS